ncbi:MAG TPA: glycosyltransferase [Candidatus Limnocylindrales bacterium]|nr:glycosyltransferase [Candidatus Limnocylindrales bacterium]
MLSHAGPGGSSHVARHLAAELKRRGHAVSLVAPGPWRATLDTSWDQWRLKRLERHLEGLVRDGGVNVIHYHYAWPFARVLDRLKRRMRSAAPLIVGTLHGTDVTHPPDESAIAALQSTDRLTTVSNAYADLARQRLGLALRPTVIANFVDPAAFPLSIDFADPLSGRPRPRLVHVSNFRPVKAPHGVVEMFAAVRERRDAELWLIGDGPELPSVVAALDRRGLRRDVRVLGYRTEVGRLLAQCDVLLMSSLEESFCLAALEAMAAGLAVVGPDVGGFTEVTGRGRTGMLYERGDYAAAARLVETLLSDDELRLGLRRAATEDARTFSVTAAVEAYLAVYGHSLATTGLHRAVS